MLDSETANTVLLRLFHRRFVVDIGVLFRALGTRSRMSVYRRLSALSYQTSFTHGGGYYTLTDIPHFDNLGLWFFRGIGFSQAKTLKATVIELIERSLAGLSYREIRQITRVRVENVLVALVREGVVKRWGSDRSSLYVSRDPEIAARQLDQRARSVSAATESVSDSLLIEVLLEIIRTGEIIVDAEGISVQLTARGVFVSEEQVATICTEHGLAPGKKTEAAHR